MCELASCNYFKACELAETIVTGSGEAFDEGLRAAKLRELGLTKEIFKAVEAECPGETEDGKCGAGMKVGDTRSFLFNSTGVPLSTDLGKSIGFNE